MKRKYKDKIHCYSCREYKTFDEFHKDSSRASGHNSSCKICSSKSGALHYKKYKDQYLARSAARRKAGKAYLDGVKESVGCAHCDEKRAACLDFHHEYPENKSFCIGSGTNRSIEIMKEEIKKCIVVCANCHRVLHDN